MRSYVTTNQGGGRGARRYAPALPPVPASLPSVTKLPPGAEGDQPGHLGKIETSPASRQKRPRLGGEVDRQGVGQRRWGGASAGLIRDGVTPPAEVPEDR